MQTEKTRFFLIYKDKQCFHNLMNSIHWLMFIFTLFVEISVVEQAGFKTEVFSFIVPSGATLSDPSSVTKKGVSSASFVS